MEDSVDRLISELAEIPLTNDAVLDMVRWGGLFHTSAGTTFTESFTISSYGRSRDEVLRLAGQYFGVRAQRIRSATVARVGDSLRFTAALSHRWNVTLRNSNGDVMGAFRAISPTVGEIFDVHDARTRESDSEDLRTTVHLRIGRYAIPSGFLGHTDLSLYAANPCYQLGDYMTLGNVVVEREENLKGLSVGRVTLSVREVSKQQLR